MTAVTVDKPVDLSYVVSLLNENISDIISEGRLMLKPLSNEPIEVWGEKNIELEDGKYRPERTPHAKFIFEAVLLPGVNEIVLMGSSQIAKTTVVNIIIGYLIANRPGGMIMMQPTEGAAKDYSTFKLEPMFNSSAVLRQKVMKNKLSKKTSTLTKKFPGGYLRILTGLAKNELRGKSARYGFGDDIDGIDFNIKEGDPIARLKKRTTTFPDYLFINTSTPTRDGASRIQELYESSNKIHFEVPCPGCGRYDMLQWENLTWDTDRDLLGKIIRQDVKSVLYSWHCCGYLMNEGERIKALDKIKPVIEKPEVKHCYGFWINELSSKLSSMEKIARDIVSAGDNTEKLEVLYNTTFGLPFKPLAGKEIDPIMLIDHVTDYIRLDDMRIPNGVLIITMAVDVQEGTKERPQRLEVNVWGYGKGEEKWILFRTSYAGNIKNYEQTWAKVDGLFFNTIFKREDGIELRISRLGVDSGDNTETVYEYVRTHCNANIIALKGANKFGAPMIPKTYTMVDKGRVPLLVIGTQIIKEELFTCLELVKEPGARYVHFAKVFCDSEYFKQLTAEHKVAKMYGNLMYYVFEPKKKGQANEQLDLMVYCYAMMRSLNVNFEKLERSIEKHKLIVNDKLFPPEAGKIVNEEGVKLATTRDGLVRSSEASTSLSHRGTNDQTDSETSIDRGRKQVNKVKQLRSRGGNFVTNY